jgi:hypothetical protein
VSPVRQAASESSVADDEIKNERLDSFLLIAILHINLTLYILDAQSAGVLTIGARYQKGAV